MPLNININLMLNILIKIMDKKELNQWKMLVDQLKNGYHLSDQDKRELLILNYKIMEIANNIHNKNMLGNL